MNPERVDPDSLYPYQQEIFDAVTDSIVHRRGLVFSVEIARQGGKNEVSAWLETSLLATFKDYPLNIVKCAPTFEPQAVISFRRLRDCLDISEHAKAYVTEAGHIIRLGQARVIFLSANENANVVGNTAHLLLEVDEAQDVSVEKFDRDFRPMAATRNATTVLYGTPWREGNLLDTVKRRNMELERADGIKRHFRFDWEEVARCNGDYRTYVEAERARLGENHPTFRTQYALLNVSAGGGFFSDDQLMKLAGDYPRCRSPRPGATYVGGLDFGGEASNFPLSQRGTKGDSDGAGGAPDSTVLTIAEVCGEIPPNLPLEKGEIHTFPLSQRGTKGDSGGEAEGDAGRETRDARRIHVVQHYSWTGLPFTVVLQKILDVAKAWGLRRLVADATGLGAPLVAALKQSLGHRIVSFVFTASSKSALGYELLAAAGTGRLQLYDRDASPECDECWRELEGAAADYKPNRSLNFYVDPSKGHDDYLMSLALAVEAANRYEPRAAVGRV
jgi:hypothetical protein